MTVVAPERVVASGGAPKRRSRLVIVALLVGLIAGGGLGLLLAPDARPIGAWERIASWSELRSGGFLSVDGSGVILTLDEGRPVAMSAVDPRGQAVVYCETSGWFQDPAHGSQFDRLGRYALGPAPRGLDRFAVVVIDGQVFVDKTQVTPGPARFEPKAIPPAGRFCAEPAPGD